MTTLEDKAAGLRARLAFNQDELGEIHALYGEFVRAGEAFPLDLEEHSLRLILEFVRPDDNDAARRLVAVLQTQGKPVPEELHLRVFGVPRPPPPLDLGAVLAQIEAGAAERDTVMRMEASPSGPS